MSHPKQKIYIVVVLLLSVLIVSRVLAAVEPDTGFEIEGNIDFDGVGSLDWWDNGGGGQPAYPPAVLIADPHSKNTTDCDIFQPSGKFDQPQNWSIQPGSVGPSQNDLTNIFAIPILPGDQGNTDAWLAMAMERTKKSGTFDLDFEFNQLGWSIGDPCVEGTQLSGPTRTAGDVVVGFELKGNPTDPQHDLQVLILQFVGPAGPAPLACDVSSFNPKNSTGTIGTGGDACPPYGVDGYYYRFLDNAAILASSGLGTATMNSTGFTENPFSPGGGSDMYQSYDSNGNLDTSVGPFEFAEAAINLTALGIPPSCPGFGSVHAKSRSSLSVTSDLKDLAGPRSFPVQCFIEGHKYLDVNGNGSRDLGEPGLNGWTINLSNGSSAVTADGPDGKPGYYRFDNLDDGSYTASEQCPSADPAWVQTEPYQAGDPLCGDGTRSFNININNRVGIGDFGNGQPDIMLLKSCPADVFLGDDIEYKFTVINTGNTDLNDVAVSDSDIGLNQAIGTLAAGADPYEFTTTREATAVGTQTNTATASGNYGSAATTVYATVSNSDDCTTTVHDLTVSKTVDTFLTRTYSWKIDKSVDNEGPITLPRGTSIDLTYSVVVDLVGPPVDSAWMVAGEITVVNDAPIDASLSSVEDIISDGTATTVDCPSLTVPANGNLVCTYSASPTDGSTRSNTAKATLENGTSFSSDPVEINFANTPDANINYVDEEITVTDSYAGVLGTANALTDTLPKTFDAYTRTVTAPNDKCGTFTVDNTAVFVTNDTGTTGQDSVTVVFEIPCEGCTPGFWQGGAGSQLWDQVNDPQWVGHYNGTNPFIHTTLFNSYFSGPPIDSRLNGLSMMDLVGSGGTSDSARRAARDMVAAYLNESAFPGTFPAASLDALKTMWYNAVAGGDTALDAFHVLVAAWNNPEPPGFCPLP